MQNKPLISVIMGIYNCADTLEEAINCIINQTYTNWELIMCDDCSNDDTYKVAQKIASKDTRIKVLKNEKNLTLAPTLNKCLEVVNGKYVARMDGDDVCDLSRFEKEIKFLENNLNYDLVSCQMNLYDENGIYKVIKHKPEPTMEDLIIKSQFCHAGCMIRTNTIKGLGGYSITNDCKRIEDYDLWVRLYLSGKKGYNIDEPLYSMRDDRNAKKRRNIKNRINESKLKYRIYKNSKISFKYSFHILIPILKYMMPNFIYDYFHKK